MTQKDQGGKKIKSLYFLVENKSGESKREYFTITRQLEIKWLPQCRSSCCIYLYKSAKEKETSAGACGGLIMVLFRVVLHPSSSWCSFISSSLFSVSRAAFCWTTGSSEFISWIKVARGEIRCESIKKGLQKERLHSLGQCIKLMGENLKEENKAIRSKIEQLEPIWNN